MNDRERELERWIEKARADVPSAEQLGRTRERLLSNALSLPPSSTPHGPDTDAQASAPAASGGSIALGLKIAAVSVVLGVTALALRASFAPRTPAPVPAVQSAAASVATPAAAAPAPAAANASPAVDDTRPAADAVPARSTLHDTSARVPHKTARSAASPRAEPDPGVKNAADPAQDFAREVALLRAAIEAHRRGDDADARLKLAEHERVYPNSPLDQERKRLAAALGATQ